MASKPLPKLKPSTGIGSQLAKAVQGIQAGKRQKRLDEESRKLQMAQLALSGKQVQAQTMQAEAAARQAATGEKRAIDDARAQNQLHQRELDRLEEQRRYNREQAEIERERIAAMREAQSFQVQRAERSDAMDLIQENRLTMQSITRLLSEEIARQREVLMESIPGMMETMGKQMALEEIEAQVVETAYQRVGAMLGQGGGRAGVDAFISNLLSQNQQLGSMVFDRESAGVTDVLSTFDMRMQGFNIEDYVKELLINNGILPVPDGPQAGIDAAINRHLETHQGTMSPEDAQYFGWLRFQKMSAGLPTDPVLPAGDVNPGNISPQGFTLPSGNLPNSALLQGGERGLGESIKAGIGAVGGVIGQAGRAAGDALIPDTNSPNQMVMYFNQNGFSQANALRYLQDRGFSEKEISYIISRVGNRVR